MKWPVLLLLMGLVFLISCSGSEEVDQPEINLSEVIDEPAIITKTECITGWKCIDNDVKAYQLENCSFTERKECPLGCVNDTCKASDVCESGFKCKGEYYRAYQSESCAWLQKEKCEYGCNESVCNSEPIVVAPVEEEAEVVVQADEIITMGQTKTHSINGIGYNLSLYNIEAGQVQISINGKRSEWLTDYTNYTGSGITILIKDIYFQSYPGGRKEITYEIS
tara:strand:+ start:394 stop:1062 length:669 start_codon:yes stop_codon:yes gene_type:complete